MSEAVANVAEAEGNYRRIGTYQSNLKETAKVLSDCVADAHDFDTSDDTKVALMDLENTIDSALLKLNKDFASTIEAQWSASASEQIVRTATHEVEERRSAAEEAGVDIDAILRLYSAPLPVSIEDAAPGPLESVKMDRYKDFCRVVFSVHDPGAKAPTTKEAVSSIRTALEERQRMAQDEDDGLQVGESTMKPVCLISSKLFEEPVRASCGHYFSRASILDAIRRNNGRMSCPSRGCQNSITESQLVRDRMMDIKVLQYLRTEAKAKHLESQTVGRVA